MPDAWKALSRAVATLFRRPPGRFPALDGIRAVAVLMVVFFHAASWAEVLGGGAARPTALGSARWFFGTLWSGVDAFFVLSGFLIGRILLLQGRDGVLDYRGFYVRRFARIVPAYWVALTIAVVVLSRFPAFAPLYGSRSVAELLRAAIPNYLFVNNYVRGEIDVMGWAWSLCVEEHFYLVLPIVLSLLRPPASRRTLLVLALLPVAPLAARALEYYTQPNVRLWDGLNFYSHTRCDGLLLGVLIAYVHVFHHAWLLRTVRRLHWPILAAAAACGAVAFWYGGVFRIGVFAVVGQFSVLSVGLALVVVLALTVDDLVTRVLAHPFWYPIARVSYGMYLVHPFVALWLLMLRPDAAHAILSSAGKLAGLGVVTAGCSFALACALFLVVELPMLRWGARVAGRVDRRGHLS